MSGTLHRLTCGVTDNLKQPTVAQGVLEQRAECPMLHPSNTVNGSLDAPTVAEWGSRTQEALPLSTTHTTHFASSPKCTCGLEAVLQRRGPSIAV